MAHLTSRSAYQGIVDRLNLSIYPVAPSKPLFQLLALLYSEQEADFISHMPIQPFTVATAASNMKISESAAQNILEGLADRGLMLDYEDQGKTYFLLPPPVIGFFEFSLMRIGDDVDQKLLSEIFYQYINVEEDFIKGLFINETRQARALVNQDIMKELNSVDVFDYENAAEIIRQSSDLAVGHCFCRHKRHHLSMACSAPTETCLTLNWAASSLVKHGRARRISIKEGLDIVDQASANGLVHLSENVQKNGTFLCSCCKCCCDTMMAARKFAVLKPIVTTNYQPVVKLDQCSGCGSCAKACPVDAISVIHDQEQNKDSGNKIAINYDICLGCGLCVKSCPNKIISLEKRPKRIITPVSSAERNVIMAIEQGKLQNLIFDNQALWNHRAMAAILGVILKLPPIKKALASQQFRSRYLNYLVSKIK